MSQLMQFLSLNNCTTGASSIDRGPARMFLKKGPIHGSVLELGTPLFGLLQESFS